MDISKLAKELDATTSLSQLNKQNPHLSLATRSMLELQAKYDDLFKPYISSSLFINQTNRFSHLTCELEKQINQWKQFDPPLSQLRESMRLADQLTMAINSSNISIMDRYGEIEKLMRPLSAISADYQISERIKEQFEGILSRQSKQFAELTRPYLGLLGTSDSLYQNTIGKIVGQQVWNNSIQLPIIDRYSVSTVATLWGENGIEKQLQFFGIEYQRFLEDIESESEFESPQSLLQIKIPPIDFWTGFSILLAILMFFYQKYDSNQTEVRLESEIKLSRAKAEKSAELIGQLLQTLIETKQPQEEINSRFVVHSRVAKIRKSSISGATVIAELFPNQVVTMLEEEGKWIKVEYFDWINQELRNGWVQKKYLKRVPRNTSDSQ
jgi:hypothetical protein